MDLQLIAKEKSSEKYKELINSIKERKERKTLSAQNIVVMVNTASFI